jgi:hypothetical protein
VDLQPEEYEFWLFQQPELKPARNTDGRNAARSACGWCSFAAVAAFAFGVIHTLIGVAPPRLSFFGVHKGGSPSTSVSKDNGVERRQVRRALVAAQAAQAEPITPKKEKNLPGIQHQISKPVPAKRLKSRCRRPRSTRLIYKPGNRCDKSSVRRLYRTT